MKFYISIFSNIVIDEENQTVIQEWTDETEEMTADEFKKDMLQLADAYEEYKPKRVLILQNNFKFIVISELQSWTANNIGIKLEQVKAEKIAFVVSDDIFASVSVKQTMEEKPGSKIIIRYFDEESEAVKWLYS